MNETHDPGSHEPIQQGGLMRCCLSSWAEQRVSATEKPTHGQQLRCQYCNNPMVWDATAGSWRWDSGTALMKAEQCPACGGNDLEAPCAHPGEGRRGCLRDARLARWKEGRD